MSGVFDLFAGFLHLVERLDDEEEHDRGAEESDDRADDCAPIEDESGGDDVARLIDDGFAQHGLECAGVACAGDPIDERSQDVLDEGGDDRGEGRANDHTDGKIHDVALVDESFEFLQELLHDVPLKILFHQDITV